MRSTPILLLSMWILIPFTVQEATGNPQRTLEYNNTPRTTNMFNQRGNDLRPPGGIFYRENWGGFWGSVSSLEFSKDGKYLLSAGSSPTDGTIRLWDVKTGEETPTL